MFSVNLKRSGLRTPGATVRIQPVIAHVAAILDADDAVEKGAPALRVGRPHDVGAAAVRVAGAAVVVGVLDRVGRLGLAAPDADDLPPLALAVVVVARLDRLLHGEAGVDPVEDRGARAPRHRPRLRLLAPDPAYGILAMHGVLRGRWSAAPLAQYTSPNVR